MGCGSSTQAGGDPNPSQNPANGDVIAFKDDSKDRDKTKEEPKSYLEEKEVGGDEDNTVQLGITEETRVAEKYESIPDGGLFCDHMFPATEESLYYTPGSDADYVSRGGLSWMRPKDLVGDGTPMVQKDGMTHHDIQQGALGDCWFLSSCAAVSVKKNFMNKIIPPNQVLCGSGYKGILLVRFWRFGEWVNVFIDDQLPVVQGRLWFGACTDPEEFWVSLIEKAYAKLHGSYESIEGGQSMDALVDLTGGLAERLTIEGPDPAQFKKLQCAYRAGSYITCSIKGNWRDSDHADNSGLVAGHAYSITKVATVTKTRGDNLTQRLLRIRNPWGNATEWKGAYSDGDSAWDDLDEATLNALEVTEKPDGEFWMSYEDFCDRFQETTVCTLGPDFDGDGIEDSAGQVASIFGNWIVGHNAGGCRNDMDMFVTNPQFQITFTQPDVFDPLTDDPECFGRCSVVIALMQEHRRSQRHLGVKMLNIGFLLYKNDYPDRKLPPRHFKYNYEHGSSGTYINLREVSARFELEPGSYVILPTTFDANQSGRFMIRVFTQNTLTLKELI